MKGKIKKFNKERGFGFISTSKNTSIFFHISVFEKEGIKKDTVFEGQEFEIEVEEGEKGLVVKKVMISAKKNIFPKGTTTFPLKKTALIKADNYSLFLNKPHHVLSGVQMISKDGFKLEERNKKDKSLENFDFSKVDIKSINQRNISNAKNLYPFVDDSICLKPDWRLTLGLGGASVYDTSLTLHHIYGIPYIPSTGIKGVVRSYIIQEAFNNDEVQAIQTQEFCDIFGCSKEHFIHIGIGKARTKKKYPSWYGENETKKADRRGAITFFDAFPTNHSNLQISLDIMNVHYKNYYTHDVDDEKFEPPADWSSPNIINFLTIKGASFQFLLGARNDSFLKLAFGIEDNKKTIVEWLYEALTNHGIGAKTSVGYGYFME